MNVELPDYQTKQDIIYRGATSVEELVAYGDRCREAGRIFDALEFYQKAQHRPGLEWIREQAVSAGDAMLFEQTSRALHANPDAEEWNRLGRQAFALKKYTFARCAFEQGGDPTMVEQVRKIAGREIAESNGDET